MEPKKFVRPLIGKRKDTPAPTGTTDYASIGKILRERLGGNFPGIEPNPPLKPRVFCHLGTCEYVYDPNTGEAKGQCAGYCSGC